MQHSGQFDLETVGVLHYTGKGATPPCPYSPYPYSSPLRQVPAHTAQAYLH